MKKIIHLFMLSCKKATELIDKRSLIHLSLKERAQLRLHKSICDACTAYEKQSREIDVFLQKHIHNHGAADHQNESLKEKISRRFPDNQA